MGVLKHSDLFLTNRDGKSYRAQVAQMKEYFGKGVLIDGVIDPEVSVLSPADGAGLGPAERYLVSDEIVDVDGGGIFTCETDLIESIGEFTLPLDTFGYTEWHNITNELKGLGITSIKGISIYGKNGLSAYIKDIEIDDVTVRNGTITPTITEGNPYSTFSFENFFATEVNYAQGSLGNYTCTFDPIDIENKTFKIKGRLYDIASTYKDQHVQFLAQDDKWYTIFANYASTVKTDYVVLSFPNTNGFDCFMEGDVVQKPAGHKYFNAPYEFRYSATRDNNATFNTALAVLERKVETGEIPVEDVPMLDGVSTFHLAFYKFDSAQTDILFGRLGESMGDVFRLYGSNSSTDPFDAYTLITELTGVNGTTEYYDPNNPDNHWLASGSTPYTHFVMTKNKASTLQNTVISANYHPIVNTNFDVKIISKDEDAVPPTITVDGGNWIGTEGTESGVAPQDDKLVKETPYDSKVTVDTTKDIDNPAFSGGVFMTDDNGDGPFTQSPYKLVTSEIVDVYNRVFGVEGDLDEGELKNIFDGDVSTFAGASVRITGENKITMNANESGTVYVYGRNGTANGNLTNKVKLLDRDENVLGEAHFVDNVVREINIGYVTGWDSFILSSGESETWGGCYVHKFMIDRGDGLGKVDFVPDVTKAEQILTFDNPNPDLKYFKLGDVVSEGFLFGDYLSGVQPGGSFYAPGYEWTACLNGSRNVYTPYLSTIGNSEIRFDPPLLDSPKIYAMKSGSDPSDVLGVDTNGDGTYDLTLDSADFSSETLPDGTAGHGPVDVPAIYGLKTHFTNGSKYITISAIENGGKYLVDTSLSESEIAFDPNKSEVIDIDLDLNMMTVTAKNYALGGEVEYQTNGGQGNIVKIENKDIYLTDTGDRDNRWIAENKATTPFYVGTPSKITGESLDKNDVQFISWNGTPESIEFTADPEGSVNLVRRHWYLRESNTLEGLLQVPFVKYTEDLAVTEGQDPGPWTQDVPELKYNTFYEVACQYEDNEGQFEPPSIRLNSGVTVGNRFKIAARTDDYYPVSDPILDINNYDGTLTFGSSSELAGMEGEMVMVTDPTDETQPPVPASYTPVSSNILKVEEFLADFIGPVSNPDKVYGGGISTYSYAYERTAGSGELIYSFGYLSFNDKVEIYAMTGGPATNYTSLEVSVDDGPFVDMSTPVDGTNDWKTIATGPGIIEKFHIKSVYNGNTDIPRLYAIRVDGRAWNQSDRAKTVLTLADDQDLKYFRPGDVVGIGGSHIYSNYFTTTGIGGGTPADVFDGIANYGQSTYNNGVVTSNDRAFEFHTPIEFEGGTLTVAAAGIAGRTADFKFYLNHGDPDDVEYSVFVDTAGIENRDIPNVPAGKIVAFGCSNAYIGYTAILLNGEMLVDGPGFYDIKLLSVDLVNNKIVVPEGSWHGIDTDGTETGDTIEGAREVTGPEKSGTATAVTWNASDLTDITLTDSNDEWIDQDNRLGLNFYMGQVNIKRLGNPFYYEPEQRIMNDNEVVVRYGRRGPIPELGVYEITESLRAGVLGFRRIGDKFEPVYDLVPQIEGLKTRLGI